MSTVSVDAVAEARAPRTLAAAGFVYVLAWLAGLATAPAAPSPDAADRTIQAFYADNGAAALVQATLVHGIAGVALAVFVVLLARRLGRRATVVLAAGLGAAAVSLVQFGMEIALNRVAAAGRVAASGTLFHAVNVADTLKLVLLAVAIAAATGLARQAHLVPRWLRGLGYALAPMLVVGGAAFVVDSGALGVVLAVSLFLLLLWVGAVGVVLTRAGAPRPA